MPLDLTYYYNGTFPYFDLEGDISIDEINDLLIILEQLLDLDKPYVFVLDASKMKSAPTLKGGYYALDWMRRNYSKIPGKLLASAIISKNETITNILNWMFKQKEPISPNFMTDNKDDAIKFVKGYLSEEKSCKIKS